MKWFIAIVIIAALGFGVYYAMPDAFSSNNAGENTTATSTPQRQSYASTAYGLSFTYPDTYVLDERDITEGIPSHTIVLMDAMAAANIPVGGEGPASIAISIFDAATTSAREWVESSVASNFQLAAGSMTDTTIDGKSAVAYRTDGLYATDNIVVVHNSRAYMFSVGWVAESDAIVNDFQNLVASVDLN